MTEPIELSSVLDVTSPGGDTRRFSLLGRARAYELADEYRARGFECHARDDDYGLDLDLDPATRG